MESGYADIIGWFLVPISFLVLLAFSEIRKDRRVLVCSSVILLLHQFLNFINVYCFTLKGLGHDAINFHKKAAIWAQHGKWSLEVGSRFYEEFLGAVYRILGSSQFIGAELSIIAIAIGMGVLMKLLSLVGLERYRLAVLLMSGVLPSLLVLGSSTLREPYQILFLMLTVYWGVRFQAKKSFGSAVACVFSALGLGLFHHGLALYGFFLVPCVLMWPAHNAFLGGGKSPGSKIRLLLMGAFSLLVVTLALEKVIAIDGFDALKATLSGECFDYVERYRHRLITLFHGRANYGIPLDTSTWLAFLVSNLKIYFYYHFAPLPCHLAKPVDWYGFLEVWFRLSLLGCSIIQVVRSEGTLRRIYVLLLLVYFSMTYLWALGTANYGTSIRHHLVTNWILVVVGGPCLLHVLRWGSSRFQGIILRRQVQSL